VGWNVLVEEQRRYQATREDGSSYLVALELLARQVADACSIPLLEAKWQVEELLVKICGSRYSPNERSTE
jgi:hypothetical protein